MFWTKLTTNLNNNSFINFEVPVDIDGNKREIKVRRSVYTYLVISS
jgi:hypothetical protein